ncbi:MAG: hypothetical protein ACR2GX_07185 [Candidatus Dormibacteria bacterium]
MGGLEDAGDRRTLGSQLGLGGRMPSTLADSAALGRGPLSPCGRAVVDHHKRALLIAPRLTAVVRSAAFGSHEGRLRDLEHRVKSLASLLRKVRDDCLELDLSPDDAIERIRDGIRYTVEFECETFTFDVARFRGILLEQGVLCTKQMNMFVEGNRYMAVHDELRTDGAFPFEVQYHTEESLAAKRWSSPLYKVVRDVNAPLEDRLAAYDTIVAWTRDNVTIPERAFLLGKDKRTTRPAPRL